MINLHTGMSVSDEHEVKNVTFSRMNGKGSHSFQKSRNGSVAMLQPQAELTPGPTCPHWLPHTCRSGSLQSELVALLIQPARQSQS